MTQHLPPASLESTTLRKVSLRILPYVLLLYIIAYIDRANIGYAALEMNKVLGIDASTYGLLAGIFFIGYFLFEVPSNILLHRIGARIWIARIMVTWGILVVLTGFAENATHLFILRFLLGVSEAGFFPGIVLYLTYWFPRSIQAKALAMFMTAIPVSFVISAPLSTWLIDAVHWGGLDGWRWMFILEGIPAVLLGVVTFFYLTDRPEQAKWLSPQEQRWLTETLDAERRSVEQGQKASTLDVLRNGKVWYLALIYILYITGSLGLAYFIPTMMKSLPAGFTNFQTGLVSMLPYIIGGLAMNYWGRHSDRSNERTIHAALPLLIPALAFFAMAMGWLSGTVPMIVGVCLVMSGALAFNGPFWAILPRMMVGSTAAVGIALVNSVGNLGGFAGPYLMGYLKTSTGAVNTGLFVLSACMILAAILLLRLRRNVETASSQAVSAQVERSVP